MEGLFTKGSEFGWGSTVRTDNFLLFPTLRLCWGVNDLRVFLKDGLECLNLEGEAVTGGAKVAVVHTDCVRVCVFYPFFFF